MFNLLLSDKNIIKQIATHMFEWHRSNSCQLPRHKIYLTSLNQLIDRRIVMQPEVQLQNKLFPQRPPTTKLSSSQKRIKSSMQALSKKYDLNYTSQNDKKMIVQSKRFGTSHQAKRDGLALLEQTRSNRLSESCKRLDTKTNPILKIKLAPSMSSTDSYNLTSQNFGGVTHSLLMKSQSRTKNFLRKGSNLQKQIVINLMRNKLLKERQQNQKKEYSNQQIIKMIQVFKGVTLNQIKKTKKAFIDSETDTLISSRLRKNEMKELKGWEEQTLGDYQMNVEK